MSTLEVKTTLKEIPVTIDGILYRIREMTGSELSTWRNLDSGSISVDEDGRATISGLSMRDPEVELLSACLYDEQGSRVPPATIRKWSATALQTLYREAQKLNGLTRESRQKLETDAKNS